MKKELQIWNQEKKSNFQRHLEHETLNFKHAACDVNIKHDIYAWDKEHKI